MDMKTTLTTIIRDGFILVFNEDKLDIVKTAEALMKAGIGNMEVTCRIQKPLEKLTRLRTALPEFCAGAASLIDFEGVLHAYNRAHTADPLPSVRQVVDAGASYLVSAANFSDESFRAFHGRVPMIPGCAGTSEILKQYAMGANLCKIFPAKELGGPAFVKAIDPAIHKMISLVPTGGTTAANIGEYIDAGVLVVGGSFSMIDKPVLKRIIDEQDYALLSDQLRRAKELIDTERAKKWPQLNFADADLETISRVTSRNFNL
ncbi:MAG: bifunctional 4-hydroxy-2-oxoglutarate aldolase/2-dehydro-3-deoxy-phosphogluconate aldolase [Phycisphaerae bacterium]|nr:bifunctional 4-hydroxy-2-oxoglutarate aldolase/2-dehydro-3-deoxy-phosphogluconate aldolase [Phycisphaerae bacterium]